MKTAIFLLATILVMAPFSASAATRPTDAQILNMRATCKGVQCDFIPMTTVELAKSMARDATTTATTTDSSVKEIRKLEQKIIKLQKMLAKLKKERDLLLGLGK